MPVRHALVLVLAALVCAGCTSSSYRHGRKEEEKPGRIFALYRIEIDQDARKAGAPLFFTEPTAGREFGHTRRAGGQFAISDKGIVRAKVSVIETSTNYRGNPARMGYTLLDFSGRVADEDGVATIHDGDRGVGGFGDRVDTIRFETDGADKLVVQPLVDGKIQAYRYHFTRSRVAVRADVEVPWR